MKISVVLPIYNEAENIIQMFDELLYVLEKMRVSWEIIAVNDGSRDRSFDVLKEFAKRDARIKVINFVVNYGQTAALSAGIENSSGDLIITIDSDLENDPRDIPRLLEKIDDGYDVVSGWRKDRWRGKFLTRKLPSAIANFCISKIVGLSLHDYGCTLKAYKRAVIFKVNLYGEMHRFIPAYAFWRGAKVTEIPVNFRPRTSGKSNYGVGRTFSVFLDLLVLKFLDRYLNRPMHFFGGIGLLSLAAGCISGFTALILKILQLRSLVETPLPILSALFIIVGVQFTLMGILGEMMMRTYYESQSKKPYEIQEKLNF